MKSIILYMLSLILSLQCYAAKRAKPIASIPFETVGTYVVIKLRINNSSPLDLILDSGIRNTIITELMPGDRITLHFSDVKELMGLGTGSTFEAYTSNYNSLKAKKYKIDKKTVFVLKEDIFNLSKHTGSKINGLVGLDFFQDYVIEINYSKKRLRVYDYKTFIAPKGYEKFPILVKDRKMFMNMTIQESDSTKKNVKMLIDTGAELGAWFQTYKENSVTKPDNGIEASIGQGFNGEITGELNRLKKVCFGSFCIHDAIVAFPDSGSIAAIVENSERDGTIGCQLLSRFDTYIDYPNGHIYMKPNRYFSKKFYYNIAGLEIMQILPNLPQVEVWKVWKNSPAEKAGIKVGDQILEVNDMKAFTLKINDFKNIFQTPSNKPLRIKIYRENKTLAMELEMNTRI